MSAPVAPMLPGLPLATGAAATKLSPVAAATPGADRAKIAQVAKQFEAIFIRQMLASARKTSLDNGGENGQGLFSSQAADTFRDQQDSHFADIAANKGTFGMARMIEKQLLARSADSGSAANSGPAANSGGAASTGTGG